MTTDVVFDFGAVLFSWRPDQLVAERFPSQAATPQAARALAHDIFHHDDWVSFDRGALALDHVIERTARRLALPHQDMSTLMSGIGERLTPIPDTLELLTRLHTRREQRGDVRLYYLSNMPAPFARVLEHRHAFLRWFDGGVFSGDVQLTKPDPAIYALLETRFGLEPARTVFVDDLAANVTVAQERGWHGIRFESAAQVESQLILPPV